MISKASFSPSFEDIQKFLDDIMAAANDGQWPLYMLDHFTHPYFADTIQSEILPWYSLINLQAAADENGKIYWLHPLFLKELHFIDATDYYPEVTRYGRIKGLTRLETAQTLLEHTLKQLIQLKNRHILSVPVYKNLQNRQTLSTPNDIRSYFQTLSQQSTLPLSAIWSLAQLAHQIAMPEYINTHVSQDPYAQALILASFLDTTTTKTPTKEKLKNALLILEIEKKNMNVSKWENSVNTLALALAHNLVKAYPGKENLLPNPLDIFKARLNKGDFDPTKEDIKQERSSSQIEKAISNQISSAQITSAHDIITFITLGNKRLAHLGLSQIINTQRIKERQKELDDIPF